MADQSSEQFGKNLRRLRLARGLSQEALAHQAGFHPTEISRLERAVRDPRLSTIVKIAKALDVPAADLVEGLP
jgi:transcriptional regulator with XRE-family HTH domain